MDVLRFSNPGYMHSTTMRSLPVKFRLPTALEDAFRTRAKEAGYDNASEYVLGLIRYDLLTRKPHHATTGIANFHRSEQDKIDDEIARAFLAGESIGGSWFENRIQQAIQDAALSDSPSPTKVADHLTGKLGEKQTSSSKRS
jgi:hypothetical protein